VILDFGCGPGFYTIEFAKIANKVIGIDFQPKMLEKTLDYARKNNITTIEFLERTAREFRFPMDRATPSTSARYTTKLMIREMFCLSFGDYSTREEKIAVMEMRKWIPLGAPFMDPKK
jgi:ubiquinone/menaquinone biosynthesis C-methylase UbiE